MHFDDWVELIRTVHKILYWALIAEEGEGRGGGESTRWVPISVTPKSPTWSIPTVSGP